MSDRKRDKSDGASRRKHASNPAAPDKKARRQRTSDLGRALRTIYDDTVREPVPDDFASLLGKLS